MWLSRTLLCSFLYFLSSWAGFNYIYGPTHYYYSYYNVLIFIRFNTAGSQAIIFINLTITKNIKISYTEYITQPSTKLAGISIVSLISLPCYLCMEEWITYFASMHVSWWWQEAS